METVRIRDPGWKKVGSATQSDKHPGSATLNCRVLPYFILCAAALGSTEENSKLSAALDQLSDVYQKVEKVHEEQARVRNIPS